MENQINEAKLNNAILFFAKNTNRCYKTKLIKLLYYLDFIHFEQTGSSVTNIIYEAWEMGPYNKNLSEMISSPNVEQINYFIPETIIYDDYEGILIKPNNNIDVDFDEFSNREIRLMNEIANEFKNHSAKDMIKATHLESNPWDIVFNVNNQKREVIPYKLALENLSVEDKADMLYRINESSYFQQI